MSTKIYTGMLAVNPNPFKVHARIREVVEPLFFARYDAAVEKAKANYGSTWEKTFDLRPREGHWTGEPIAETPLFKLPEGVYRLILELQADPVMTFSELDFGYEAVLLPNGLGVTKPPLVLLFSERAGDEYRQALMDAGVVVEYGYWNNTDQPEDVTDREWKRRELAWSLLDVPAQDGLIIRQPSKTDTMFRGGWY